ncbi:MAG: cell division protein FtsA [Chloroflexia bacterium]|nr:cell division protein FtsA [Chloroflexia bacterium]
MTQTVVGIDVGTTKIVTLVGELGARDQINILGVGLTPSKGMKKGIVVNVDESVTSIVASIEKAERLSGYRIGSAYVGVAGGHIQSLNSRGVVAIPRADREIVLSDQARALEAARAIAIPTQREIIHVIPRSYIVDGQEGILDPVGLSGFRLEVEAHIVTGAVTAIQNLIKCVQRAGVEIDDLVLQPLASSEAVLTEAEKEMGVMLVDCGGGTTDVAIFIDGSIWHSMVLPVGGNHITNDIAIVLRTPFDVAEYLKIRHGRAHPLPVPEVVEGQEEGLLEDQIEVESFVGAKKRIISRELLHQVIEARVDEIFQMLRSEVRRVGYDGLLPAGVVLTGGTALLPGIEQVARSVLNVPVRIGVPGSLGGLAESIDTPAYATSVGLVRWGLKRGGAPPFLVPQDQGWTRIYNRFKSWLREFLP